jgi:phage terminase small subunit
VADIAVMGADSLANARHERFCQEYLIDRNGTAAYQRAGYGATGNAAEVNAARLLRNAQVAARVAYLEAERTERVGMAADDVLRELAVIGTSDVRHYEFTDGGIKLAESAPDVAMRAVQSVRRKVRTIDREDGQRETVEEVEFRLWNKPAALRMAGEHHRLFVQTVEVKEPERQMTGEQREARLMELLPRVLAFLPVEKKQLAAWIERGRAREVLVSGRAVKPKGAK